MSPETRKVIIIAGCFLVVCTALLGLTGAYVYRAGMIEVQVEERCAGGDNIHIKVPGALVLGALACVPDQVFSDIDCPEEAEMFFPMVSAALKALKEAPDFVMVEVEDGDDTVFVRKKGNHLVVDVESSSERVHATVPLQMVQTVLKRVERMSIAS